MEDKVPWGTIAGVTIAGGTAVGAIYLGYKYFVEPGNLILAQYREMLTDLYKETKKFLEDNAKLEPPIYGLTSAQEAIIKAKEDALDRMRDEVEGILASRNIDINSWVTSLITGIVIAFVGVAVVDKLLSKLLEWRKKPVASSMQSSYSHSYLIYEVVTNEMAALGKLNIASGFLSTMQTHYSAYIAPALNASIAYYNSLLATLVPGTLAFLVATSMLNYVTFEASASGIMGVLWAFWLPPLIP